MIKENVLFVLLLVFSTSLLAQPSSSEIVTLKIQKNNITILAGNEFKVVLDAEIKWGWHINSNKPNDEFLIPSKVSLKRKNAKLVRVTYPKAENLNLSVSDKPVSVFSGKVKIEVDLIIEKTIQSGKQEIPIEFSYQACNDQTCMPPTDIVANLTVDVKNDVVTVENKSTETRNVLEEVRGDKLETTNKAQGESNNENSIASTIEKSGLFLSLIFVFLGGLALNLTPCVYPLIPITIGYFGGQSEGKTSRLFILGVLYVLGMALTYSVIGVITSLSGAVFGTLLQNKFVIMGIAALFITLSLSQFGVYEFKLPDSWVMKAGGAKGGVFGAFFMGLTMGIVAAPCIGPFVLGLVTYVAAKADPLYGFLMFFVLAVGLGFPYLLLALFSGKIKNLPRAGFWMEGVKHIFGFILLAMAFYFIDPILPKSIQGYSLPIFGIFSASILLFVDKTANNIKGFKIFKIVFSIIVITVSIYALIPAKNTSPEWKAFSEEKHDLSLKRNERMIIDFYADWCIPCKELDAQTFSNENVVFESQRFTCYKVDMTETLSDATEKLRNRFKIVGMPTVLVIDSKGKEVERLTGFVNATEFLNLIKRVK
jgi:thioredoxin:protein disulfide reductase